MNTQRLETCLPCWCCWHVALQLCTDAGFRIAAAGVAFNRGSVTESDDIRIIMVLLY